MPVAFPVFALHHLQVLFVLVHPSIGALVLSYFLGTLRHILLACRQYQRLMILTSCLEPRNIRRFEKLVHGRQFAHARGLRRLPSVPNHVFVWRPRVQVANVQVFVHV